MVIKRNGVLRRLLHFCVINNNIKEEEVGPLILLITMGYTCAITSFTTDPPYYVGQGYCREWDCVSCSHAFSGASLCVNDLAECEAHCGALEDCVGFAYAESPDDNIDGCKSADQGRCSTYVSDSGHRIGGTQTVRYQEYACYSMTPPPDFCGYSCTAAVEEFGKDVCDTTWANGCRNGEEPVAPDGFTADQFLQQTCPEECKCLCDPGVVNAHSKAQV